MFDAGRYGRSRLSTGRRRVIDVRVVSGVVPALGVIIGLVGGFIVLGWALGATLIPSGVATSPMVKANTGLCFLLAGGGLVLIASRRFGVLARLLAVAVIAVGLVSLLESVLSVDLGIDQLLFRDSAHLNPGRMAPNTALAFVFCGGALLLGRSRASRVFETLAAAGATLGWLAVIGFAAGLSQLLQVGTFVKMGLPTAVCLLLLGVGLVLVASGGPLRARLASDGPAGPLVRRLFASVVVVPPVVCGLLRLARVVGVLDAGEVILLVVAAVALSLLGVAVPFARSLDEIDVGRRHAERELSGSERRHRELVEASLDAFIAMDGSGVITDWNAAAEALFGWPAAAAIGRSVAETIVPERLRARHQAGLARLAAGGEGSVIGQRLELPALRRDGSEVPVELSISMSEDHDGRRFNAFVHDIGERDSARRALEDERRQLDNAQRIACIGSWSWEPVSDRTEWTPEMYRIFDRDPAEGPAASEDFFAYLHPEDRERIVEGYAQAFGAGDGFELDYRIALGDGSIRFLHGIGRREGGGRYVGTVQDITPLRKVEQALTEAERSNRTLAMIVEQSDDAIIAKTLPDGLITAWNRGAEQTYGYVASEILGKPISVLIPSERKGEEVEIMRQLLSDRSIPQYETSRRCKDGSVIDVSVTITPIHDDDDEIVGASAISRDITARKESERRLAETARFFELSRDLICTANFEGSFVQLNDTWEAALGWSKEELCSRPLVEFVHPDDIQATDSVAAELVTGATVVNFANRYRTKSGGWRWLEWTAVGVPELQLIYANARDVTDRVQAQDAQREAEARFRGAFDGAPIGMALVAPDGSWLQVNRSLCEIVGYSEPELLELSFQAITHPEDLEADLELVRQLLANEIRSYQMEKRYFHKDGSVVWVNLSVSLVRDRLGEPVHFVSQIEDITERKRTAEVLRATQMQQAEISQRLELIITNLQGSAVVLYDRDMRLQFCEGPLFAGTDLSQMLGRRLPEFVNEETSPRWSLVSARR